jgi:hypothetical protein
MAVKKEMREESRRFIQEWFEKNPRGSIAQCARDCSNAGVPAYNDLITTIRMEAKKKLVPDPVVQVKPKLTRLTSVQRVENISDEFMQSMLNGWLEVNPSLTREQVDAKLLKEFGRTLDAEYIEDTLAVARELAAASVEVSQPVAVPVAPQPEPVIEEKPVAVPIQKPAVPDIVLLTYKTKTGALEQVEIARSKLQDAIEHHISQGVKPEDISVWKKMKVAIRVQVDLE